MLFEKISSVFKENESLFVTTWGGIDCTQLAHLIKHIPNSNKAENQETISNFMQQNFKIGKNIQKLQLIGTFDRKRYLVNYITDVISPPF